MLMKTILFGPIAICKLTYVVIVKPRLFQQLLKHDKSYTKLMVHYFQGIVLVYDITDEKSFENIQNWMKGIKEVRAKKENNIC